MKILKAFFGFGLLFFLSVSVYPQKQTNKVLYLKNGSIIYGLSSGTLSDSIVKIKDKCGNIWAFNASEISAVKDFKKENTAEKEYPYYMVFDTGIAGFGGYGEPAASLLVSEFYKFKKRYFAGVTAGVENFEFPILPVAAEFQMNIFDRNVTPYVYFRSGYAFKLIKNRDFEYYNYYREEYKGGFLLGAGIGVKRRFSSIFALTFSIGYRHQHVWEKREYIEDTWWNNDYERHYLFNRAAIRIGLVF